MKSKLIIPSLVAVAVISGATLVSTTSAFADFRVDKLTDTQQAERSEERKLKMEQRLSDAVTEGKITAEQKTLLETKLAAVGEERKASHDSGATRDEMKASMTEARDELKAWAEENNIELRDVMPQHSPRGEHGPHSRKDQE
jgi:hypothetical protein